MLNPFSLLDEGTLLQGRYRVKRLIGKGGMGAVYEARDERLGHTLALKQNFYGADEQLKHAFEREARLLANLKHPALPRVTDYFTEDFGQFLVMEFIAGKDLMAMLKESGRPFSVEQALAWADQLLDALQYLHTQQPPIIHRDVKPQNLKLSARGEIMLLDFGLAKGTTSGLTSVMAGSSVVGFTPGYAPPEQVTGKGTDERSDLFSLSATLYYLLTNQAPPDAMLRLGETTNDEPDPLRPAQELNALVPPALSGLLHNAMALKRNARPASAKIMRQALKECAAEDEGTRLRQPRPAPHDTPSPIAPTPKPRPIIVGFPSTPLPRTADVGPQPKLQRTAVKPWALLVAFLYLLIIFALPGATIPLAFWKEEMRPTYPALFSLWPYWVILGVLVFSQIALLKVPVGLANNRTITRRSLLWPVIAAGATMGLLIIGAIFSLIEFITQSTPTMSWNQFYGILAVGGLTWVLWAVVFYRLSRNENPKDVISRQCRYMLKGSILELLVAVPTHIVARSRDYCCAGFMTFLGITLGLAVMLMSYGPGVFFLFVDRWKRLHKYRMPPEGQPHG